jgi:hypothetical protein
VVAGAGVGNKVSGDIDRLLNELWAEWPKPDSIIAMPEEGVRMNDELIIASTSRVRALVGRCCSTGCAEWQRNQRDIYKFQSGQMFTTAMHWEAHDFESSTVWELSKHEQMWLGDNPEQQLPLLKRHALRVILKRAIKNKEITSYRAGMWMELFEAQFPGLPTVRAPKK